MKTKILFLTILLVMGFIKIQAQVEKNKLFSSGAFRIEVNKGGETDKYNDGDMEDKYAYFDFDFQPKVGYTVIDNMPIGLWMDIDCYRQKAKDDEDKYKQTTFLIGPFIRYYFADIKNLMPYAEASVGFGTWKSAEKSGSEDDWDIWGKEGYFGFRVGGGLSYFFNDFVAADLFMGFNHYAWTDRNDNEEESRADWDYKSVYNEFLLQVGVVVMLPL